VNADTRYFAAKLDKIQYALDMLRQVDAGRNIKRLISHLEDLESVAVQDLVEAEQDEE